MNEQQSDLKFVRAVDNGNGKSTLIHDEAETLARYNAERYRGVVHTPEWQAAMARLQAQFDARGETVER